MRVVLKMKNERGARGAATAAGILHATHFASSISRHKHDD
jgi:hypothetical protein